MDGISEYSTNIKLSISPKILSLITSGSNRNESNSDEKDAVTSTPTTHAALKKRNSESDITEAHFYERQTEMELPILEYEEDRLKSIQVCVKI